MLKRLSLLTALMVAVAGPAWAAPVKVVASFSILGDMVRQIGGDQVAVTTLVGPDGDAHVYQPTPADAKAVTSADLIVVNGLGFEGWFERLFQSSEAKAPVVVASAGVSPQQMEEDDDDHAHGNGHHGKVTDPHAWQNLANGRLYVANIAEALSKVAPDRAALFQANATAYVERLAQLETWVTSELGAIPKAKRKIITSHDAFGYFGQAYGVTFLAPVGISTEAEPSPKDVAALVKQMKQQKVRAVFVENMADPRLVRQIAKDAGGVLGGELYADALSAADGPAATYEAMFRHNVTAMKAALTPAH